MARQKEFDRTQALEKAMRIFWQQGYAATSMQELVNGMGIGRGSLYDTFGSKEQLYHEALAHYRDTCGSSDFLPLTEPDAGAAEIVRLFEELADNALGKAEHRGCFAVQSATERAYCDEQVTQQFMESLDGMEAMFERALQNAQAAGDFPVAKSPRASAHVLVSHVLGIRTLARAAPRREMILHIVQSVRDLF